MLIDIVFDDSDNIYDIFLFKPNNVSEFSVEFPGKFLDFGFTKGCYYELKGLRRRKLIFEFSFFNAIDFKNFFYFWLNHKHATNKFWCPTWFNQFKIINDVNSGTDTIVCKKTNFVDKYNTIKYIFLFASYGDLSNALLVIRKVIDVSVDDTINTETFTVNSKFLYNIKKENILIAGEVILARFIKDNMDIKINFIKNYQEFYITSRVGVIEVLTEY